MAKLRLADLSQSFSRCNRRSLVEEIALSMPEEVLEVGPDAEARAYFVEPLQAWHPGWLDRDTMAGRDIKYFLDEISEQVLASVRRREAMLVVNTSTEAAPFLAWNYDALQREIRAIGLPPEQVIVISGNSRLPSEYAGHFGTEAARSTIFSHNAYLTRGARILSESFATQYEELRERARGWSFDDTENRDFLSFNLAPRSHRILLVANLLLDNLLDRGLVSFPDLDQGTRKNMQTGPEHVAQLLRTEHKVSDEELAAVEQLRARGRISIDESSVDHLLLEYKIPVESFHRTWFSIVTETSLTRWNIGWVTEKCLKPLLCFHPFFVLGSPGTLADLRDLGFRSFAPYFDERYDEIEDPNERYREVYRQIKSTLALSPVEKAQVRAALFDVLDHNCRHLLFNVADAIKKRWTFPLLDAIR